MYNQGSVVARGVMERVHQSTFRVSHLQLPRVDIGVLHQTSVLPFLVNILVFLVVVKSMTSVCGSLVVRKKHRQLVFKHFVGLGILQMVENSLPKTRALKEDNKNLIQHNLAIEHMASELYTEAKKAISAYDASHAQIRQYVTKVNDLQQQLSRQKVLARQKSDLLQASEQKTQILNDELLSAIKGRDQYRQVSTQKAAEIALLNRQCEIFRTQVISIDVARTELQFENEILKCSPPQTEVVPELNRSLTSQKPLNTAPPFVLVLIDGDAYFWSQLLWSQPVVPAGELAAQSIRTRVREYIMSSHREEPGKGNPIPLASKIICRVLCNYSGSARHEEKPSGRFKAQLGDFVTSFNETFPLFDYTDCGRGKERVDTVLIENFHTFLPNPACYKIFFAACNDNGFARALEQYRSDEELSRKICLVHTGFVMPEIAQLDLEKVEWRTVFQFRPTDPMALRRSENIERHKELRKVNNEMSLHRELSGWLNSKARPVADLKRSFSHSVVRKTSDLPLRQANIDSVICETGNGISEEEEMTIEDID